MSRQIVKCDRCRKTVRANSAHNWNIVFEKGFAVAYLCPNCQSPEENAEAEINEATTRYGVDSFGRMVGFPKV